MGTWWKAYVYCFGFVFVLTVGAATDLLCNLGKITFHPWASGASSQRGAGPPHQLPIRAPVEMKQDQGNNKSLQAAKTFKSEP